MKKYIPLAKRNFIEDEILVFYEDGVVLANLTFKNPKNLIIKDRNGNLLIENVDYRVDGNHVYALSETIPYFKKDWLHNKNVPKDILRENDRYKIEDCLLVDPKCLYSKQYLATYEHQPETLKGIINEKLCLPKTYVKLKERKTLNFALLGDSISVGANSSYEMGFSGYDHWIFPSIKHAEQLFNAKINFFNFSVSGKDTSWAINTIDEKLEKQKIDLLVIAFGMNDATVGMTPETFIENISTLINKTRAHNSDAEFILIATPTPNNKSKQLYRHQKDYYIQLKKLESGGITVVNMTKVFKFLLERKEYVEISGNNLNHPNDFSYSFYTDAFNQLFENIFEQKNKPLSWKKYLKTPCFEKSAFIQLQKNLHAGYLITEINGKTIKNFVFYGIPKNKKKSPAIVLVHGAGGNAFAEWVSAWVDKGYVAISIDINCTHFTGDDLKNRKPNEDAGIFNVGSFASINKNPYESWTYQSVAQIISAHSFLLSLPQVDKKRTAIMGISWGGVMSLIALGADKRFNAGAIIYSAGYITEDLLGIEQKIFNDDKSKLFYDVYLDPQSYVKDLNIPVLFNAGLNDQAFSPFNRQRTYNLLKKKPTLAIIPDLYHDNASNFNNPIALAFMQDVFEKEHNLKKLNLLITENKLLINAEKDIKQATVYFTNNIGDPHNLKWIDVKIDLYNGKGEITLPTDYDYAIAVIYYGNLYSSSDIVKLF